MNPIACRRRAPLGPEGVRGPGFSEEVEQALAAAEDARAEATVSAQERAALDDALRQARAELRGRDAEIAALREELARARAAREVERASASATAEELRMAMEELQSSAVSLEIASDDLARLNGDLERRVAERTAALAESETRLRAATDAVPHLVWTSDADGMWNWANRRWVEYTGQSQAECAGLGWLDRVHPEDRDATLAAWGEAVGQGQLRVEHRLRAADGTYRWFSTRALPERSRPGPGEGTPAPLWHGTSTDVDDARRAETALRESEARFRGFAETSSDVLWIIDASARHLEYLSPAFEQVWGEPRDAVARDIGRWAELLHPEDRRAALEALTRVIAGERVQIEYRIRRASDGAVRWIHDTGFPIRDGAGRIKRAAGLAQDVTEQREAEERQKALLNELNHRVKNALAGAQAIAAHTARGAVAGSDPGGFVRAFEERLRALARAHDLLNREGWRGASLAEVVNETMAAYDGASGRVSASGPQVRLAPGAVVALHMAFHELASNAAKYGALSVPEGRVEVAWTEESEEAGRAGPGSLDIRWRERNGPPVPGSPAGRGFGSKFLDRGLPTQLGGRTSLVFAPTGLEYRLRLPLSDRVRAG